MKIFKTISRLIKDEPDVTFKGLYQREEMDQEDLDLLSYWEETGDEGDYEMGEYRITIESLNTRET